MKYLKNVTSLVYNEEDCTGCGKCLDVCPHGVFGMNGKKAFVTDRDLCIECGACQSNCEFGAISVQAGVGCASAIIYGMITGKEPQCGCDEGGTCC